MFSSRLFDVVKYKLGSQILESALVATTETDVPNSSVTATLHGGLIFLALIEDPNTTDFTAVSNFVVKALNDNTSEVEFRWHRNGTGISSIELGGNDSSASDPGVYTQRNYQSPVLGFLDFSRPTGSTTYKLTYRNQVTGGELEISYMKTLVLELGVPLAL